jgi:hypothetical protein
VPPVLLSCVCRCLVHATCSAHLTIWILSFKMPVMNGSEWLCIDRGTSPTNYALGLQHNFVWSLFFLYQNLISFKELFHQCDITPLPAVEYKEYPESQRHCDASNKIATISCRTPGTNVLTLYSYYRDIKLNDLSTHFELWGRGASLLCVWLPANLLQDPNIQDIYYAR